MVSDGRSRVMLETGELLDTWSLPGSVLAQQTTYMLDLRALVVRSQPRSSADNFGHQGDTEPQDTTMGSMQRFEDLGSAPQCPGPPPKFHKFSELPAELRCIVYKMYLENEVTRQNQVDNKDESKDPKSSWPDISVGTLGDSSNQLRHIRLGGMPIQSEFAPNILCTNHTIRNEVIDVFLAGARIIIHAETSTSPLLYFLAFLRKFGTPRVFDLVCNLKFKSLNHEDFFRENNGLLQHCKNLRHLEIRLCGYYLTRWDPSRRKCLGRSREDIMTQSDLGVGSETGQTSREKKVVVLRELHRAIIYTTEMSKQVMKSHVRDVVHIYPMN